MGLFGKRIPKVCPKCGREDGLHMLQIDPAQDYTNAAAAVNPFTAPIRNPFGQNLTRTAGRKGKSIRYHCDNCGYEQVY